MWVFRRLTILKFFYGLVLPLSSAASAHLGAFLLHFFISYFLLRREKGFNFRIDILHDIAHCLAHGTAVALILLKDLAACRICGNVDDPNAVGLNLRQQ